MDQPNHFSPGTAPMNLISLCLFCLSFAFHKISFTLISFGWLYDGLYKFLALVSVLMVITINAKKFIEVIKARVAVILAYIRARKESK